ncbi:ABC transporter ATP-binding protein [Arvimicrobium flavum]|uniref:ABC transporter ATP-binding protein n=1 Tax=Arvimicrobium flavum TaxID=3393320 RepID=UPI00237A33FE|nr:ABC transporter ATP-binding protein [Mesorhizobium shangrilense]
MTLLSVSDVTASLGGVPVLHGVSFAVRPGEFVGLIGPNGAGKSTLLRSILGLTPSTGTVAFDGRNAGSMSARERAASVAYLAQERDVAWPVPVEMVVSLGRAPYRSPFAPLTSGDREAIDSAMRRMDVEAFRDRSATELSGGELARVLIARALAQETPLLLADEPTAGLDPSHQVSLMRMFTDLAAEGRSVLATLHDLGLAARWCSRLLLLERGRIIADGAPEDVLTPERIREVYGVTAYSAKTGGKWIVQPLDLA